MWDTINPLSKYWVATAGRYLSMSSKGHTAVAEGQLWLSWKI